MQQSGVGRCWHALAPRISIIAAGVAALGLIGADYLHRARPSIAAAATESGRTASHRLTEADIEDDTASQDDYWAGQAFALAHAIHLRARCPADDEAFRRGCEDVASGHR